MTTAAKRATERIRRFAAKRPDAVRLARFASLAVRADAPLLRALRLALLPSADAGCEADLWFSPLTESASSQGFVLDPHVTDLLRWELAAEIVDGEQRSLDRAAVITAKAHEGWPPSLRLEERVTWLALKKDGDRSAEIDALLRQAAKAMADDPARGVEVARWTQRALPRMPSAARDTEAALLLALGASERLGGRTVLASRDRIGALPDGTAWILPSETLSRRTKMGVRLYADCIEFVEPADELSTFELPRTTPLYAEISWGESGTREIHTVAVTVGRAFMIPHDAPDLRLQTLVGEGYAFEAPTAVPGVSGRMNSEPLPTDKGKQPNPASPRHLRIFLASPDDVAEERMIAREVLGRLQKDPLLQDKIAVDVVAWDSPGGAPTEASMTPQVAIEQGLRQPSQCDIVVVILWSRMGTPLPKDWKVKTDGSPYRSGTEWEYLDALRASENTGFPKILVYRRTGAPSLALDDPGVEEKTKQRSAVQAFFAEFRNPDGSLKGAYSEYDGPTQFRDKLENDVKALVTKLLDSPQRLGDTDIHSALAELSRLGALILKLDHFKCIADRLHELYMDKEVRFLRSEPQESVPKRSLKRAARSGETALEDIRALDEPKLLPPNERKRKEDNLRRLDAALEELLTAAGAQPMSDKSDAASPEGAIVNFIYEITAQRHTFNELAKESWRELGLPNLGTTFAVVRDQLSTTYPSYMARVDEGFQALSDQLLFVKCDFLANEHELLEKALMELFSLRKLLETNLALTTLESSWPRIKGFMDGARRYWDQFLLAASSTDDWAIALLSSGKSDWNAINKCRDEIDAIVEKLDQSQRDAFLNKLREAEENIEPHFQAVDEALKGAFREVKNLLGEALMAVPAESH